MNTKNKNIKKIDILSRRLSVASDPNRLKIMCLLFTNKKVCVSDISKKIGGSIAITSHHLQSLAKEGILEKEREGKNICYKLSGEDFIQDLKRFICKYK